MKLKFLSFISFLILIVIGCELFIVEPNSDYSRVRIVVPNSRALIDQAGVFELIITSSDFEDINILFEDNEISVDVLQGVKRSFLLNIYNLDKSLLLYSGETITDVTSASNTNVKIDVFRSARQIKYHGNNETSGEVPSTEYYNDNTSVKVLGNTGDLVLDFYTFIGWNTVEDGSGTTYFVDSLIDLAGSDINLYAVWTKLDTFNITYNLEDGVSEEDIVDTNAYIEGASVTLSDGVGLTLASFTFVGWATESEGEVVTSPYTMPANDITLYAIWTALPTYSVTYDINGGTGTIPTDNLNYLEGSEVTLNNGSGITLSGYSFIGWATELDGDVISSPHTMLASDLTLYALWTLIPTYSVSYNLNGGSGSTPVDSSNYIQGQIVSLSVDSGFSFPGYSFTGWSLTSTGSILSAPYLMPGNNINLFSIWETANIVGYYAGDGSGSGGSGDYSTDYSSDAAGGNGGGGDDSIIASSGNDVIFGDGSGGGGGGEQFRVSPGGVAGSGSDTIFGGSGNDIIFGDGFNGTSGLGVGDYNGANGGFGGGGGGGGSQASPQGNGGTGGLLAGGGGAQSSTTVGTSLFGGFDGGVTSKPTGGTSQDDKRWGGYSAIPHNNGSGYFTEQSLGGSGNNAFGAGGGAGFGGLNSQNQPIDIGNTLYNMASGGYGQGGDGTAGTTDLLLWEDASGLLYNYVYGILVNIFVSQVGTLDGVGSGLDIIDGQGGNDDLFGLGGDDIFVFEINDAGTSSTDIIWDFNRLAEYDLLKLTISGIIISDTIRDNIISAQTTPSGTDRQLVFTDSGKTVNIIIKNINRDINSSDFYTDTPS